MTRLGLFDGVGIEIESMIVDARTLDVAPISDALLDAHARAHRDDDPIEWSNELVLHVIEFKTNGPAASLDGLADAFTDHARRADVYARERGARLLGTGAHPWMDPLTQTRLWPHDFNAVYEAYNRIFDCRGHGWSNLQSTHINLPFANDEEFGR
ncbi:MAG: glutamate--cysteine ligase, partial [Deltaproteobacteria bacterium]|nr:glutamate--cysteine ligase [Deltaproteobacteria bacterium]